jgi:type IX secretion system PorP/SprF family membrane protein
MTSTNISKLQVPSLKSQVLRLWFWLLLGIWVPIAIGMGFGTSDLFAQQTPQYTQFMLNNYGMNPAACGISGNKMEALVGIRRQWVGFDNMPVTSFFNFNSYFGRRGGGLNQGWHGIGAYFQGDRMGEKIKTDDFYVSYTYLMRMARKGFISFGMAGGARRYHLGFTDITDPVMNEKIVWLYPDFIPGVKYFNSKWTLDLSVKQLYKFKVKQGNSMIGSPTKLPPHLYFSATYKWWARSYLLVVHSLHLKYTFSSLPSVDYNVIAYLNKHFAVGMNYRHLDSFAAIVQYRFDKLVIGIAYDYSIAPYRIGFANSQEIMMGFSPSPYSAGDDDRHYKTAECPTFQY